MNKITVSIPDSILNSARELAAEDKIGFDQFVASALAEKVAAIRSVEYLKQRGRIGSREAFDAVLNKVPAAPPVEPDRV
jgi:hypothetical protein